MPFYLLKNEPVALGLQRIAHEQIDIALANFQDGSMPRHRQVHSLRARCKKLRGVLRLMQPLMGDAFKVENERFRDAARTLAGHREKDVVTRTIAMLGGSRQELRSPENTVPADAMEAALRLMVAGKSAVERWPLELYGFADIAPGFSRTYRKCRHAFYRVCEDRSDTNFHRLRKWGKYHWYHVRILEKINRATLGKQRKRLRKLQLTLGDAHDLAILQAELETEDRCDPALLDRARVRKRALYGKARKIGKQVFKRSADELVADYSRWWVEWTD